MKVEIRKDQTLNTVLLRSSPDDRIVGTRQEETDGHHSQVVCDVLQQTGGSTIRQMAAPSGNLYNLT